MSVRVKRRREAAEYIGVSVRTLLRLVAAKKLARPIKLTEKSVGWKVEDLDAWVDSRRSA